MVPFGAGPHACIGMRLVFAIGFSRKSADGKAGPSMTKQATSGEIRRLKQTANYNFGSWKVGVMNVWREKAGTMVAQLAIFDPATGKDEELRVRVDDEFAVGEERYRVVEIVSAQGNDFAYLEVVPTD
jgi:hypothetical protein